MKSLIKISLALAFSIIGVYLGNKIAGKLKEKRNKELNYSSLSIKEIDIITTNQALKQKKSIFALFHPSCDFCQADAEQFLDAKNLLKDLEVLWVSYDNKDSIRKFSIDYGLDTLPNMHFAYMDIEAMLERYGNVKFPTFLAYDNEGQLIEKFVGLTKPEEILKVYQMD